jgi:hypothetical protein
MVTSKKERNLKIGDTFKVRSDLSLSDDDELCGLMDKMIALGGQTLTVWGISTKFSKTMYFCEEHCYAWLREWMEE